VHDRDVRSAALDLIESGLSLNAISKRISVSRATLREWRDKPARPRLHPASTCVRCQPKPGTPTPAATYGYVLGVYLGDGCISAYRKGVFGLRIACADAWPGLTKECSEAIRRLRPSHSVSLVPRQGCTMVTAYWKHWPCLFPQHGPGMKHTRPIVLEPWQQQIVDEHTEQFLRGLFHSDGCRITNWTRRRVAGELKRYEYPRYFFTNQSRDILALCSAALDRHRAPPSETQHDLRRPPRGRGCAGRVRGSQVLIKVGCSRGAQSPFPR